MKHVVIIATLVLLIVATTGGDESILMRPQMAAPAASGVIKWSPWTTCTKTCGNGMQTRVKTCGGIKCGIMEAVCADFPCNGPFTGQKWSKCSKPCGGGTRFRENKYHNHTQTMSCNTQVCGKHYGECKADLVFVLDSSSSIGALDWFKTKQFAIDVVKGLQIAKNLIQVGAILYSPDVRTAFDLVHNPTKSKLVKALWNMPYLSGTTNTAGGLRRMKKMFDDVGRPGVAHIAVLITDGQSNIDRERTVPDAAAAKAAGIDLYVVAIGAPKMTEINSMASKPHSKYVYSVNTAGDLSRLTRIITKETCPNPKKCDQCTFSGPCDATECGVTGKRPRQKNCYLIDSFDGKKIAGSDTKEDCSPVDCSFECPVTTTTQKIVLPPPDEEVECTLADWNAGRIWIPHPRNCHLYFVCERVYHNKFRMHGIDCGVLYWNLHHKLCFGDMTASTPGCKDVPIVTLSPPAVPADPTCANNLQLLLNFENGFDDVSCHNSPVIEHGAGVTRVNDNGNMVACFDGSSFLEVPSIKSWFMGKVVTQFTIAVWYKRSGSLWREGGLVSNGGCLSTDSGVQVTSGYTGAYAGVTATESFPPGLKQLFAVTSSDWHHVVMVYNGFYIKLYLDGFLRETAPANGFMMNGNSMFTVGRLCTYKYFNGCIDNVRVYGQALSDGQVFALK